MRLPRKLFVLVLLLAIVFYAYQLLFYVPPVPASLAHRALVSGPNVRGDKLTTFKRHLAFCERNAFLFDESTAEADFTGKRALSIVRLFHQSYVFDKYEKLRREGGLLHPPPSHGLDYMSEACRKSNADRRCWENMGSFKPSEGICNLSREGGTGDGSKMLCLGGGNKRVGYGPTVLDQSGCIIYSVGSNMNFKFEEAMHRRSKCEIHTFDCTVKSDAKSKSGYLLSHSRRFYFHHICIGDPSLVTLHNHDGTFQGSLKSLGTIMQQLGHDKVDLLKMDIEDSEYAVFRDMFASFEDARLGVGPSSGMHLGFPLQLSFELHIGDYAQAFDPTNEKVLRGIPEIVELERMLRSMGYISVGFEPNVQVPRGGFGAEITMVRAMC